ncbi:unnamed protein product [Pedinophyceae sp. YPF-701]|nr:unnamed protein product [Pedinophyceae sp. YPF-701]
MVVSSEMKRVDTRKDLAAVVEQPPAGSRAAPGLCTSPNINQRYLHSNPVAQTYGARARASGTEVQPEGDVPAACQVHENDLAEVVIVCEPEGTSLMMGGLHPRASLYEKPLNLEEAKAQHENFRNTMRRFGVKVLTVREILRYAADSNIRARVELEEFALNSLTYRLAEGFDPSAVCKENFMPYLSEEYKRTVLEEMSTDQLLDVIMTHPTVTIKPSGRDTGFAAEYTFEPLSNLIYTRDQQITTCRGIVMARLRSSQRQDEVDLMRLCFNKLGLPIVGEVKEGGFLEGGDYFAAGPDLCFVGIGLRSNRQACLQLMEEDLFGTRRVAVVRDELEMHQDRMHLDCVFSILSDNCCVMLEDMMGQDSATKRLVDEYVRDKSGKYHLEREGVEFAEYVRAQGYSIIPVPGKDQLLYGCNVLNLGNSTILAVHDKTARNIARSPQFSGDVFHVPFEGITCMYGAVHCSSQVVRRKPRLDAPQRPGTSNLQRRSAGVSNSGHQPQQAQQQQKAAQPRGLLGAALAAGGGQQQAAASPVEAITLGLERASVSSESRPPAGVSIQPRASNPGSNQALAGSYRSTASRLMGGPALPAHED